MKRKFDIVCNEKGFKVINSNNKVISNYKPSYEDCISEIKDKYKDDDLEFNLLKWEIDFKTEWDEVYYLCTTDVNIPYMGLYGTGDTIEEAQQDVINVYNEMVDALKEENKVAPKIEFNFI